VHVLKKLLGLNKITEAFLELETLPVASGAIAQVYRGVLRDGTEVAVKVRHPQVRENITLDLAVLQTLAKWVELFPGAKYWSVGDAVFDFTRNMLAQVDMRREAMNLVRFRANFADEPTVVFPRPILDMCSEEVLVETFEQGVGISKFLGYPRVAPLTHRSLGSV